MSILIQGSPKTPSISSDPVLEGAPELTRLNNGNIVITNISQQSPTSSREVAVTILSADGQEIVSEHRIPSVADEQLDFVSVAALSNGNFVSCMDGTDRSQPHRL